MEEEGEQLAEEEEVLVQLEVVVAVVVQLAWHGTQLDVLRELATARLLVAVVVGVGEQRNRRRMPGQQEL